MWWQKCVRQKESAGYLSLLLITIIASCTEAAAAVEKLGDSGLYAGLSDNAILLVLAAHLAQMLWALLKWVIDKYFREQKDKDAELKKFRAETDGRLDEIVATLSHIQGEIKTMGRLPSESEIMEQLERRMEFLVFKAARDLGLNKDTKR